MSAASFSAPVVARPSYVGLKPNTSKLFQMDSIGWNQKTVSNGSKVRCMKVCAGNGY